MASKVVIVQELFSSYRGPIFDRLSLKYELVVLHGKRKTDLKLIEKDYSICVPSHYFLKERLVFLNVFSSLQKVKPEIIIHQGSPGILSLPMTWLWCKLNKAKFVIWTHGFERHQGFRPYRSFRSFLRLVYYRMADGILLYTKNRMDFFNGIISSEKLFFATNTIDTTRLLEIRNDLQLLDINQLRGELKMVNYFNIVFIGRLLKEKLVDHLLLVTLQLKNRGVNVKTHIIGSGPEKDSLEKMSFELGIQNRVVFYGEIYDDIFSGRLLFASDVMVIPGYVGLAINHAYCFNLPVISYKQGPKGPFHSPEIDFLDNYKTGLLVTSHDVDEMTSVLSEFAVRSDLLRTYKVNVIAKIESIKIEKMEDGFTECIEQLSKQII